MPFCSFWKTFTRSKGITVFIILCNSKCIPVLTQAIQAKSKLATRDLIINLEYSMPLHCTNKFTTLINNDDETHLIIAHNHCFTYMYDCSGAFREYKIQYYQSVTYSLFEWLGWVSSAFKETKFMRSHTCWQLCMNKIWKFVEKSLK